MNGPLKKRTPSHSRPLLGAFDLETAGLDGPILACGWRVEGDPGVGLSPHPHDLIDKFFSLRRVRWYAHNAGEFDLKHLLPHIMTYMSDNGIDGKIELIQQGQTRRCIGVKITVTTHTSKPRKISGHARRYGYTVELRDSYALLARRLEDLATVFAPHLPKLHVREDYETWRFDWSDHSDVEYLTRDVDTLLACLLNMYMLLRDTFGVYPGWTTGSTAINALLRDWDEDWTLWPLTPEVESIARESYIGGAVYLRDILEHEDVVELDYNSLYPSVQRGSDFPYGRSWLTTTERPDLLGVYRVRLTVPEDGRVPIVGVKRGTSLLWPVGTFEATLTTPLLEWVRGLGYSVTVLDGVVWSDKWRPFDLFVDKVELLKRSGGGGPITALAKIIANSCGGKFGSSLDPPSRLVVCSDDEATRLQLVPVVDSSGDPVSGVFEGPGAPNISLVHPEIASYMTSYAKIRMHKIFDLIGHDHVLYSDTDSVFLPRAVFESVRHLLPLDDSEFDHLKIEAHFDVFQAFAPKTYYARYHSGADLVKAKGIPARLATVSGLQHRETVAWQSPTSFVVGLRAGTTLTELHSRTRTYPAGPSDTLRVTPEGRVLPPVLSL